METAEKVQKEFFSTFVGKKLEVLMEKKTPQGEWEGLSENYIRVRCKSKENLCAKVCLVSIKNLENGGLTGNIDCFSKG